MFYCAAFYFIGWTFLTLLAVSDNVWNTLITTVSAMFLGWLQHRHNKGSKERAQDFKQTFLRTDAARAEKLETIAATGQEIHALTNSSLSDQMAISLAALQRIASLTNDPADIELAHKAAESLRKHEAQQQAAGS